MLIIFFILGLIIGSFLNVVIYRLELAETLLGRSHCPHCKTKIRWYDNVPVISFILLRAKCRECERKISWQYPVVELLTGIIFLTIGYYFFSMENLATWVDTAFYLVVFSAFLTILVYDFKFMEIPMIVLWSGVGVALLYALYWDANNFSPALGIFDSKTFSGILGGVAAFLPFFLMVYFSKETWMGMGDAYLAFLVGMVTGWPLVMVALTIAFTLGAFVGIALILLKKKTMQSQIPFGPFLAAGTFLAVVLAAAFPMVKYFYYL